MTSASAGMQTFVKKEKFGCAFRENQSKFIGTKAAIPKKLLPLNSINILHNILVSLIAIPSISATSDSVWLFFKETKKMFTVFSSEIFACPECAFALSCLYLS